MNEYTKALIDLEAATARPDEEDLSKIAQAQEAELKAKQKSEIVDVLSLQFRKVVAFELIADALQTMAKVQSEEWRLKSQPPVFKTPRPAEITRVSDDKTKQFNDNPTTEWMQQTEAALPQEPSRFQKRFDEQTGGSAEKASQG